MREDLDDLRPFHHLFDISVFLPQFLLLLLEVLGGTSADLAGHRQHHCHHRGHDMTIMDTPTKMTVNPAESVCGMLWVMT